jgi:hypothetical protein
MRDKNYLTVAALTLCSIFVTGCADQVHLAPALLVGGITSSLPTPLRVYHNPYQDVQWSTDVRLKTQLHDHVGSSAAGIAAYDTAGYDVMSLMTYSGVASMAIAWHERHWPPEKWVAPSVLNRLRHIKFFIPNGEEVGYSHIVSPLMTTYIAKFEPAYDLIEHLWNYGSPDVSRVAGTQQAISLIAQFGGFPIVAHPVEGWDQYKDLRDFRGMEVYSGYVTYKKYEGVDEFYSVDRNADMEANWDRVLARDDRVIAVAVNDHFGPDNVSVPSRIRDTGKVIVLAHAATYDSFAEALRRGAVLAIKDVGETKEHFPVISSIEVANDVITVNTNGLVTWVSGGNVVGTGPTIRVVELPSSATYVRAVVTQADGSAVYTQAFSVRPVFDKNGDGLIDAQDDATCANVSSGTDQDSDHMAACSAWASIASN